MSEVTNPTAQEFLYQLIEANADARTMPWLAKQEEKLQANFTNRTFYLALGMAPRFSGKQPLALSEAQREVANQVRANFRPNGWSLSQLLRTYLLLLLPDDDASTYVATLTQLLETAEVDEQVAVYAALPLLPHPQSLVPLAVNGLRTNITRVFDAIALENPFPADYLDEAAWNQMILKAVFMGRPLYRIHGGRIHGGRIYGADVRTNPTLARMLVDFAHERWAAHRPVTPELWRFVAPYADASHRTDLDRVIASESPLESAAGKLACRQSTSPDLQALANNNQPFTWQQIGEAYVKKEMSDLK